MAYADAIQGAHAMDTIISYLNSAGKLFIDFALPMLIQSGILIVILLGLDFILRKKVRAIFRYCIWMLVLVKLILPTTLSAPTGIGYWFGINLSPIISAQSPSPPAAAPKTIAPSVETTETLPNHRPAIIPSSPANTTRPTQPADTRATAVTTIVITWQGIVLLLWLAVVMTLALLLIQRWFFVKSLISQSQDVTTKMTDLLEHCRAQIGIKRNIVLKLSPNAASPSVCCLFHPVILMPQGLSDKLNPQQLKAVLLYELADIKRGDLWVSYIPTILQIK